MVYLLLALVGAGPAASQQTHLNFTSSSEKLDKATSSLRRSCMFHRSCPMMLFQLPFAWGRSHRRQVSAVESNPSVIRTSDVPPPSQVDGKPGPEEVVDELKPCRKSLMPYHRKASGLFSQWEVLLLLLSLGGWPQDLPFEEKDLSFFAC